MVQVEALEAERQVSEDQQISLTDPDARSMATSDYMVFNITKDDIRVRMAITNDDVWPLPSITETLPADPSERVGFTQFLIDGREVFTDVVQAIYDETNEQFGTDVETPN